MSFQIHKLISTKSRPSFWPQTDAQCTFQHLAENLCAFTSQEVDIYFHPREDRGCRIRRGRGQKCTLIERKEFGFCLLILCLQKVARLSNDTDITVPPLKCNSWLEGCMWDARCVYSSFLKIQPKIEQQIKFGFSEFL